MRAVRASGEGELGAAGCGEAEEGETTERLADQLAESAGLTAEQAGCVAETLVEELGEDEVKDIELSADEPESGFDEELVAATETASTKCEIDLGPWATERDRGT